MDDKNGTLNLLYFSMIFSIISLIAKIIYPIPTLGGILTNILNHTNLLETISYWFILITILIDFIAIVCIALYSANKVKSIINNFLGKYDYNYDDDELSSREILTLIGGGIFSIITLCVIVKYSIFLIIGLFILCTLFGGNKK
ncbi:hypothetical protein CBE01nite_29570 [Clostridium beijerinckii]|uniref:Uncharacterized protein n=1 Tax=Clostridium beijerinckii TaxID=1520 RepID=A0AB74VDE4_CLOBE|nr:hypothetical protein [Clostridium beijerinckii]NRZ28737.1 phosphoglycerol transferase MdoB-like AlkP superfamily enzyme [Clostridium beijerinckii]NYB95487.1 phosphoglycerol transferase MdoB-like AlkP superfamily enzyme [Clostridium beijerinckii]OOM19482.1 hypothetical protein CLBEI_50080 [Clostridium beijerinckii]QUN34415.1 hypothetical protein KEC93_21200 [Clostridium beijerinckii]SQB00631.1 Uncharacterised protein [Clostridium beijerinckii]